MDKQLSYYEQADKIVSIVLRARDSRGYNELIRDLQQAHAVDKAHRYTMREEMRIGTLTSVITDADAERTALKNERRLAKNERRLARKMLADADAQSLDAVIDYLRECEDIIAEIQHNIDTLDALTRECSAEVDAIHNKHLADTMTDRADLTQDALVSLLEYDRADHTAEYNAYIDACKIADADALPFSEWNNRERFKRACNYVGKRIGALASPCALDSYTTVIKPCTQADADAWREKYGDIGANFRVSVQVKRARASDVFQTMEWRDYKIYPCGWYLVTHYHTISKYQHFSALSDADRERVGYIRTADAFVERLEDISVLSDLINRANFSGRERDYMRAFLKACKQYNDFEQVRASACASVGIYSAEYKKKIHTRATAKLRAVADADALREIADAERKTPRDRDRVKAVKDSRRADADRRRAEINKHTQSADAEQTRRDSAPIIKWCENNEPRENVPPREYIRNDLMHYNKWLADHSIYNHTNTAICWHCIELDTARGFVTIDTPRRAKRELFNIDACANADYIRALLDKRDK